MTPAERLSSAKQHYELAVAAHRRDKLAEAGRHYGEVHRLFPEHPGALHGLGLIALREHHYPEAVDHLQQACRAARDNSAVRCDLGHALLALGRYEEALSSFRAVLRAQPGNIAALSGAGDALNILGRTEEALTVFRKILAIDANNAAAHFGTANALLQSGETAEARAALERAIALAPKCAAYHRTLAEMARFEDGDPRLAALEALAREEQSLPDEQKAELHFALAKAYDDLNRNDDAFAHLEKGNRLRRKLIAYDERLVADFFADLPTRFTAERLQRRAGDMSDVPIFVIGMPRSGTTLVEQILSSDASVLGAGELSHVQNMIAEDFAGKNYPRDAATLPDVALARFGKEYLRRLGELPAGIKHVVDKFPGNFQHIGLIHLALPNAKIIHVRRDPIDTCFSCYSKLFLNGLNYTYDLGELGRYYRMYDALMAHWRSVLPEGAMLEVQYETLVGDFENEVRCIVDYSGLAWNERFLSFHRNERAVRTHSRSQVRQPLFTTSIGRWRRYEAHLKPLLDALNQRA
ncbi:MAG TPA: sulfotransferase [Rhizomicrobium sp.]|jgi:tetratricopeptide (TPR) repeat protein